MCHRRGTSPVTWSSAIARGRRVDSADKKASVDGFLPLGGNISILTLLSHEYLWMVSTTRQGPISMRFAIMLYHCIIPEDEAARIGEIVLEQRLNQSGNRLRKTELARSTNAQRKLIRD